LLPLVCAAVLLLGNIGCGVDKPPPVGSPSPADGEAMARMMRKGSVEPVGPPSHATFRFTDVTAAWGVDFSYLNGERAEASALPETLGGGVALVDWDGDGRRDLFRSIPDIIGTSANYVRAQGWKPGEPWLDEVRVPEKLPWEQADLTIQHPRSKWAEWGVTRADGSPLPKDAKPASA